MKMVFNPITEQAIVDYCSQPSHALIITGPNGSGKASTAMHIVSTVLNLPNDQPEKYSLYPYLRTIRPVDNKAIPIETIRELQGFLSLRIPGTDAGKIARAVVIEDAHLLTTESQNALLKTLEEPPTDTIIVLTTTSTQSLLPTIQSRVRQLFILPPSPEQLGNHFSSLGFDADSLQKALLLSGELPGLAAALLTEDASHPLIVAVAHARGILQSKLYERLLLVDSLSKQKQLCQDILYVLGRMSRMALLRTTDPKSAHRWQHIMSTSYSATEQLSHNTQTKLIMTNLMLEL